MAHALRDASDERGHHVSSEQLGCRRVGRGGALLDSRGGEVMDVRGKRVVLACALIILKAAALTAEAQETAAKLDALIGSYAQIGQFSGSVLVSEGGRVVLK